MKNFLKLTAVGIVGYIVGVYSLSYKIKSAIIRAYFGEEEESK